MKHLNAVTTLSLTLLLSSCAVGPDYAIPEDQTPPSWQNSNITSENADHQWWQQFKDPILSELVNLSYQQNHDIHIAIERLRQARAQLGVSTANLLPDIGISAQKERELNTVTAFPVRTPFSASQAHFDASWEIDLFGKNRRQREAHEALATAALENLKAVQVSIAAEVARTYIEYRLYQEQLRITDENLETQKKTVGLTHRQFSAGQASRFDYLRADAQLKTTESQRPHFQSAMTAAQYRLEVLLGKTPESLTEKLQTTRGIPLCPTHFKLDAPVNVIRRRPDIAIAERQLAAATAMEGVAIANMYPKISLTGFFGFLSPGALAGATSSSPFFSGNNKAWFGAGSVSMPLFTFGKIQSAIEAAEAEKRQTFYAYQQAILKALAEIETALKNFEQEKLRTHSLGLAVKDAQQAVEISHKSYTQGLISLLDVLDVERNLFSLQSQLAESQAIEAQNLIRLNKAVGGGWQEGLIETKE